MLPCKHLKSGEKTREKGVVLILVLGILSILVIIGLEYVLSMRLELKIAQKFLYTKDAAFAADTGIQEVVRVIREKYRLDSSSWYDSTYPFRSRAYTFLDEAWAVGVQHTDTSDTGMQYDTRYGTTEGIGLSSNFQDDTYDGHFIQGVQDEQGKININTSEREAINWLEDILGALATGDIGAQIENMSNSDWTDTYEATLESFATATLMTGAVFYGEDYGRATGGDTNDHTFIEAKDTVVDDNILQAGMEDFITVHGSQMSDSGVEGASAADDTQWDAYNGEAFGKSPINVNTASWSVLHAIFRTIVDDDADARILANAVINYRTGGDGDHGDGDDDPFDGFYNSSNTSIYQAAFTAVTGFNDDGIDNEGNGFADDWSDTQLYAGGARGEFETFLDRVANQEASIDQDEADALKGHLSMSHIRDFDAPAAANWHGTGGPDGKIVHNANFANSDDNKTETEPFCFSSNTYSITSVGKKRRPSGETGAIVKRRWIIQMDVP